MVVDGVTTGALDHSEFEARALRTYVWLKVDFGTWAREVTPVLKDATIRAGYTTGAGTWVSA